MVLAFCPVATERSPRERLDAATWDALRALGDLTTLANVTHDPALLSDLRRAANTLTQAALALDDIAALKCDRVSR